MKATAASEPYISVEGRIPMILRNIGSSPEVPDEKKSGHVLGCNRQIHL
jgi:hypothetical protein